jgi:hypothetical protein
VIKRGKKDTSKQMGGGGTYGSGKSRKQAEEGKMEKRRRKMCKNKIQEQESGTGPVSGQRFEPGTSRIKARVLTSRPIIYFISSRNLEQKIELSNRLGNCNYLDG